MEDVEKILALIKTFSEDLHDWCIIPLAVLGLWRLFLNVASSQLDFLTKFREYKRTNVKKRK